jgi:glycosyltransferase involved in cell wall biosynthesis
MREAALVLSPEAPYPLEGGGQLRTASLLEYLARRYDIDLITFREPAGRDPREALPSGLARETAVIDLPRHSKTPVARGLRNVSRLLRGVPPLLDRFSVANGSVSAFLRDRRYALAIVEHFWCAPYWEQLAPVSERTVLDLHNIESVLHARCAAADSGFAALAHGAFSKCYLRLEREWLPRYDLVLTTSETDASRVRSTCARAAVYPNGIPWRPLPREKREAAIAFSGNLEYHPNIAAARYFARDIWPTLRARCPDLEWRLIGRNPEILERMLGRDPRIRFTGRVDDAICELARVQVAVVPLLSGSGTRFKIVEAWAAGTPVVSTTTGAEGLPTSSLLIADAPGDFVEAVCRLLRDPELAARMSKRGRATFDAEFTWDAAWAKLAAVIPGGER